MVLLPSAIVLLVADVFLAAGVAALRFDGRASSGPRWPAGTSTGQGSALLTERSNCSTGLSMPMPDGVETPRRNAHFSSTLDSVALPAVSLRVINAGQGTTGTRAIHQQLCALGVPSVHWLSFCNVSEDVVRLQTEVIKLFTTAKVCIKTQNRTDPACKSEAFILQLRRGLQALVTSGVVSLGDAPYNEIIPEIVSLVPKVKVILSLRDATEWATKHLEEHSTLGGSVLCKPGTVQNASSYFNILECAAGTMYLADALELQSTRWSENGAAALGGKFAFHNRYVSDVVAPANLAQWCAWDSEAASTLATIVQASHLADAPVSS